MLCFLDQFKQFYSRVLPQYIDTRSDFKHRCFTVAPYRAVRDSGQAFKEKNDKWDRNQERSYFICPFISSAYVVQHSSSAIPYADNCFPIRGTYLLFLGTAF